MRHQFIHDASESRVFYIIMMARLVVHLTCSFPMKRRASLYHSRRLIAGLATCLSLAHGPLAQADETVHSIDGVRGALHSSDTRQMFDASMSGKQNDGFGTRLPAGFTTAFLVAQMAPGEEAGSVVMAGAKPWPLRPHSYVAMLCLADNPADAAEARKYGAPPCDILGDDARDARRVWFGVFESTEAGAPRLVARTESPVATPTDWNDTNIELPDSLEEGAAGSDMKAMPTSWSRFDLAAYQLRTGEYAFGVRAGWSVGYAGGGADFEALYLFAIDGNTLHVVFAQPMAFDKMIAGDWHKDGTRSHDVDDGANALTVLPSTTAGYHDLQLREKAGGKWRRTFKWSSADHRYQ
ncbi:MULTISPECIES: hypothetical protein [unclassified Paraburkholderia]|uniref:hypothetical protein n=1 Tax=unclassified Paraburkholderia TaxID=2615204 RepID=UPI002AAFDCFD|nr:MULTISPECIES: hypothetical protein [unclassified Paraburkholderia]